MKPALLKLNACTECPFFERKRIYTSDSWEEAYDWHCKKEDNKVIASYVEWRDKPEIPDWCPLRK